MDNVSSDELRRVNSRLGHPVIDSDGHAIDYLPLVRDILVQQAERMPRPVSIVRRGRPR